MLSPLIGPPPLNPADFNLVQFLILLLVLIETLYVHKLVSWQRYRVAYRLDRTMLTTITLAYVAVLTILFVLPFNQSAAIAIACVSVPSLVTGSLFTFWFLRKRETRRRVAALVHLRETPIEEKDDFREALRSAYAIFDFDGNESLDIETLRQFLSAVYSKADKQDLNKAIMAARQFFSENGTISFEGFEAVFDSHIVPLLGTPAMAHKKIKRSGTIILQGRSGGKHEKTAVHPEPAKQLTSPPVPPEPASWAATSYEPAMEEKKGAM